LFKLWTAENFGKSLLQEEAVSNCNICQKTPPNYNEYTLVQCVRVAGVNFHKISKVVAENALSQAAPASSLRALLSIHNFLRMRRC
jgi:hypothetical protein